MSDWKPIETCPKNRPVILANFDAMCLLACAPHVWTATLVTDWVDGDGNPVDNEERWNECSHAAMNENGEPTHWMELPPPPPGVIEKAFAPFKKRPLPTPQEPTP